MKADIERDLAQKNRLASRVGGVWDSFDRVGRLSLVPHRALMPELQSALFEVPYAPDAATPAVGSVVLANSNDVWAALLFVTKVREPEAHMPTQAERTDAQTVLGDWDSDLYQAALKELGQVERLKS